MLVDQAIFTSARTNRAEGYHLIARSPGIDNSLGSELAKWGPSHASLADPGLHFSSLSYFPLLSDYVVIARTMYGGPEYSDRGSLQVVTRMLVLQRHQLEGYQRHPVRLLRTVLSLGYLHGLPGGSEPLPPIRLPDRPLVHTTAASGQPLEPGRRELLVRRVDQGGHLAIVGAAEPLPVLDYLLDRASAAQRADLSFTTGLRPSALRPFRFHFFTRAREPLRRQLAALGIECLSLER